MPRRRDERARVLGPYWIKARQQWLVTTLDPKGNGGRGRRIDRWFGLEQDAHAFVEVTGLRLARLEGRTVGEAIDEYEKELAARSLRETSWRERGERLRVFFEDAKAVQVSRLSAERCGALYVAFREGRSVDTHRNVLGNAKGFYAWCVEQGWAAFSPIAGVKGIGKRKVGKAQLTGDEARRFYGTALRLASEEEWGALGAAMLLGMGLRQSEVRKRKVRDLDLGGTVLRITDAKSPKGNRTVHVPTDLQPHLLELAEGRTSFEVLFAGRGGAEHTRAWLLAAVRRVCDAAGVPRVCPHGLRGTHASLALEAVGVGQVADSLGHVDTRTTLRHYAGAGAAETGTQERTLRVLEGGKR